MRIRVRGPSGAATITLPESATWGDLKREISETTSVPDFDIKHGYPPQTLDSSEYDNATPLSAVSTPLDGAQLTIAPHTPQVSSATKPISGSAPDPASVAPLPSLSQTNPPAHQKGDFPNQPLSLNRKSHTDIESDPPEIPLPQLSSTLVLRIMPDDNSCLFRALGTALLGPGLDSMTELRSIVAQQIQSQPAVYSSAVLEKAPDEYCKWIQRADSWGGGIEMSILSVYFGVEVCSINVQDLRVDRFNEGKDRRVVLVYSGIHYDVVAVTPTDSFGGGGGIGGQDPEFDRKVFEVARLSDGEDEDGGVLQGALELCKALQAKHYYTDTQAFTIKCNVCGWTGTGETGATKHATATGHMDFGESS